MLSRAGLASRREVEEWIRAGRITVNGVAAVLGTRVKPTDQVRLDDRLIRQREPGKGGHVFICHRSPGNPLVPDSSHKEQTQEADAGETTGAALLERLPKRAGRRFIAVSPMPRVDGGLELVSSDGDLAVRLQRSIRGLVSEFSVRVHGELSEQGLERIRGGELDSGQRLPVERCESAGGEGSNRWYTFAARGASGKEVRQLFERQGALVSRVLRIRLGTLVLDRLLARGRFREVQPQELESLLAQAAQPTGVP